MLVNILYFHLNDSCIYILIMPMFFFRFNHMNK
jgi:hypothetical protein